MHAALTVRVAGVRKVYEPDGGKPVIALADVDLDLRAGEMAALVGPSGCGKSTLLNLIGCADVPTAGTVEVAGRSTAGLRDAALSALRRRHVGTVFQFFNLLPSLSVGENVALPLLLSGKRDDETARRVRAVLASVGMLEREFAMPDELSGGQTQRVAIARAIVHAPAVVLADEPTGNLDGDNARAVIALLRAVAAEGRTVLVATHDPAVAASCDRRVVLRDGRIVAAA